MASEENNGLLPVLNVGDSGRSGSTLIMSLLGSSPLVAFDRMYPFEIRCLTHVSQRALLLAGDWPSSDVPAPFLSRQLQAAANDRPTNRGRSNRLVRDAIRRARRAGGATARAADISADHGVPARIGAFSTVGSELWRKGLPDPQQVYSSTLRSEWATVAAVLARGHQLETGEPPVAYAEKVASGHAERISQCLDTRMVIRVRDPRDIWASITAFDQKRGFYGFGRRATEEQDAYLQRWLASMRDYHTWAHAQQGAAARLVIRYEDAVLNPAQIAEKLASFIGVELDASRAVRASEEHMAAHRTTPSVDASIGRHMTDLDPATRASIEDGLGGLMEPFGYSV